MTLIISHRGNQTGRQESEENSPNYIREALRSGFYCEVDFWVQGSALKLGHDKGQFLIDAFWISDFTNHLIFHCKNEEAIDFCDRNNLHWFYHKNDEYTITSKGWVWGYPGSKPVTSKFVILDLDDHLTGNFGISKNVYAVCTDRPQEWKLGFDEK